MCAGGPTLFPAALIALRHLRSFHGSTLPVELVAADADELASGQQAARGRGRTLPSAVELVVLSNRLQMPANITLRGFWIKPLALASSRFLEVLLMDVDVIFFRPPELLFASSVYQRTGTLFFRDFLQLWHGPKRRQIVSEPEPFLRAFIANFSCTFAPGLNCLAAPSLLFEQLNLVRHARLSSATFHEQDSSVVLWHRERLPVATRILHRLSDPRLPWQHNLYRHMHGDKETYWLAAELARVEYAFSRWQAGIIGPSNAVHAVHKACYWEQVASTLDVRGGHLHFAPDGDELAFCNWQVLPALRIWLNSGLSHSKESMINHAVSKVVANSAVKDHLVPGSAPLSYPQGRLCLEGASRLNAMTRRVIATYIDIAIASPRSQHVPSHTRAVRARPSRIIVHSPQARVSTATHSSSKSHHDHDHDHHAVNRARAATRGDRVSHS